MRIGGKEGNEMNFNDRILRELEVIGLVGLSRTTIWRLERANLFPRRKRLGLRAVGWSLQEIQQWLASRPSVERKP